MSIYKDILFGLSVGDALGVPVEFKSREEIAKNPVTGMRGNGTYNMPPGTFSDDSSLAFCLAEALTHGYNLQKIADNFVSWLFSAYWTANGTVFDVGNVTKVSLYRLKAGYPPETAGGIESSDNGNGSLMRILPLLPFIFNMPIAERFKITKQVSSMTHGHIRSVIACFYYLEFAQQIARGINEFRVYDNLRKDLPEFLKTVTTEKEISNFDRLLKSDIYDLPSSDILTTGYVVDTLEASIWCLMKNDRYTAAVLEAVNLGDDSDTTGAVTGGLAGLLYGCKSIPENWINQLARKDDIEDLANRMESYGQLN